jgi:arginine decarboxylase
MARRSLAIATAIRASRRVPYRRRSSETKAQPCLANTRFGMSVEDMFAAAEKIDAANHLTLSIYHAMVGSQIVDPEDFVERLTPPMQVFAQLKKIHPTLEAFDFGGGIPIAMTLDFTFDYHRFAELLLERMLEICQTHQVKPPDIVGELGRYTVTEHGAHLFKIVGVKENNSPYPWYLIDGSIMSSFPDSWALGEHFIVLPLNHLDQPFRRVHLGGLTCDSDDIYPPTKSQAELYLPVETDDLHVGFFAIGAYQEMLGGAGGSKHCVIPEADELIIDRDEDGQYQFDIIHGQGPLQVLDNLGYRREA